MGTGGELRLSADVIKVLDSKRGSVSRTDFVRSLLQQPSEASRQDNPYATQEEFEQFCQRASGLLLRIMGVMTTFVTERDIQSEHGSSKILAELLQRSQVNDPGNGDPHPTPQVDPVIH